MKSINYLILSLTFDYGTMIDDEVDEMLQQRLDNVYLGFEYLGSQTDGYEKTSQYSMMVYEEDMDEVNKVLWEAEDRFDDCQFEWTFIDEETAEEEGYSF